MRKYIFTAILMIAATASAQSSYEAVRLLNSDLVGTARYIGMGGSMASLGTDISVMGTNPAGTALYRSNDVMLTAGLSTAKNEVKMAGTVSKNDNTFFSIDNAGVVMANNIDSGILKFLNVGFNYKRRNNLQREFAMAGATGGYSQMYQMQALYDAPDIPFDIAEMNPQYYTSLEYSWLALLAADGGLLYEGYYDEDNNIIDQGALNYDSDYMLYASDEQGGVDLVECNLSCNLNDRVYLGVTLGFHSVDYSRYSYYGEDYGDEVVYTIYNNYETKGSGFDLKLGAIFRPFEESPFRFGIAVHTPTWYQLTDRMSAEIEGHKTDFVPGYMNTVSYDAYGDDYYVDYNLRTPWRYNVSAAYTFGNYLALNAEYEYSDYTTAEMEYSDSYFPKNMPVNEEFKSNMRGVSSYKIGAEFKFDKSFSMRCGYNHVTTPFKKGAAKYMLQTNDTNTEYLNSLETNNYSVGIGYRGTTFYADASFLFTVQDAEFYPFYDTYDENGIRYSNPGAKVTSTADRLVFTLGMRF